jgi:exopolysaccharide biosynthesis polyprenyl glycosylphosphotransferase
MTVINNSTTSKPIAIPKWLVALVDLSLTNLGLFFSFLLVSRELQGFQIGPLLILLPSIALVTVYLFNSLGLYSRPYSDFMALLRALATGVIGITLFSILFVFLTRAFLFQRTVFLLAPLLQFLLLLGWRIIYWKLDRWVQGQKRLLIIGSKIDSVEILEQLRQMAKGPFTVTKVIEPDSVDGESQFLQEADAVMLIGTLGLETKNRIIRDCFDLNLEVLIVPELYEIILTRASMTQINDTPVIECQDMQPGFMQYLSKRSLDLLITLLLLGPALLIIIPLLVAIRFVSPGPVIYSQERVGLKGKIFTLYKLRTMIIDAEAESGPVFAMEEDDRVTAIGRFLRTTRLDELPQLYNVLRGDLSIVGPRPERPYFVEQFEGQMPEYRLRHLVKPGITGLAQVAGHYATNTYDKLRYDLYYIADYSLLLDFKILLLTIPTLLNREAAKGMHNELAGRLKQNG